MDLFFFGFFIKWPNKVLDSKQSVGYNMPVDQSERTGGRTTNSMHKVKLRAVTKVDKWD